VESRKSRLTSLPNILAILRFAFAASRRFFFVLNVSRFWPFLRPPYKPNNCSSEGSEFQSDIEPPGSTCVGFSRMIFRKFSFPPPPPGNGIPGRLNDLLSSSLNKFCKLDSYSADYSTAHTVSIFFFLPSPINFIRPVPFS